LKLERRRRSAVTGLLSVRGVATGVAVAAFAVALLDAIPWPPDRAGGGVIAFAALFGLLLALVFMRQGIDRNSARVTGWSRHEARAQEARGEDDKSALERANATLREELARCESALKDLQANETHFRALVETSGDIVFHVDSKGGFTYVNGAAVETILGYRAEEVVGAPIAHFATAASAQALDDELFRLTETQGSMHVEGEFVHRTGRPVYLSINAIALCNNEGRFVGASGTAVDVSELKTAEILLRQALSEQHAILDSATVGIAIVEDGKIVRANAELERMFATAPGSATGMAVETLCGVQNFAHWRSTVDSAVAGRSLFDTDEVCRRADGSRFWCRVTVRPFNLPGGRNSTIWVLHDVTDRKHKEQAIEHAALHDALTGLPNRALLSDRLDQAIKRAKRTSTQFGVLFVDLDRFKMVNDSIGHDGGDELLRAVAERLRRRVRSADTVARQGGDEFIVMLPDVASIADVEHVAKDILTEITAPVSIFGNEYVVTGSIGMSIYPDHGTDAQSLLKHADAAMYRAKAVGKNTYCVFTQELDQQASEDIQIENLLRSAIERGELEVFYQPRIELATGRVCSLEALARWRKSSLGWVDPCKFIPIAERAGLIGELGDWVLRRACKDLGYLTQLGYGDLGVSVNLSHCQLTEPGLVANVRSAIEECSLSPRRIELELTETAIARDVEQAVQIMECLEKAGVSIAIDDFGTGYSSLSKLKCFPIRTLKIDRAFVSSLPHEEDDVAIVLAIITMAKRLRIRVVAEGVETTDQREFLIRHECDEGQGYLFGRPMPLSRAIEALALARGHPRSAMALDRNRQRVA
jgi:diguanylate cyclase (GGDEF)-like protein/PAS domain S-box-containing protein